MTGALLMYFYCLVFEKEPMLVKKAAYVGLLVVDESNVSYESSAGQTTP